MFDLKIKLSIIGVVIFILPMVINIGYVILPPVNAPAATTAAPWWLEIIEKVTRILYAISICYLVSEENVKINSPWLWLGILFLVLYYMVWMRYFLGGRDVSLLGKSFLFVPIPLAVFPVLYYIFAALWVHNYVSVIIMIIFGIAHNIISYISLMK